VSDARRPAGSPPAPSDLSARPAPAPRLDLTALEDDGEELDLPIAEDWDAALGPGIADIPPPAPRSAVSPVDDDVQLPPPPPRKPEQRLLFSDALDGAATRPAVRAPSPRPTPVSTYAESVTRVLDPRTPLTVAMSLIHRLRPADLRRVAAARHLPDALVTAARRRLPRTRPETRPR